MDPVHEITRVAKWLLMFFVLLFLWTECATIAGSNLKKHKELQTFKGKLYRNDDELSSNNDSSKFFSWIVILFNEAASWLIVVTTLYVCYKIWNRGDSHNRTTDNKPDQIRLLRNILRASDEVKRDIAELRSVLGPLHAPIADASNEPSNLTYVCLS